MVLNCVHLENSGFEDWKAIYKQIGGVLHKLKDEHWMPPAFGRPWRNSMRKFLLKLFWLRSDPIRDNQAMMSHQKLDSSLNRRLRGSIKAPIVWTLKIVLEQPILKQFLLQFLLYKLLEYFSANTLVFLVRIERKIGPIEDLFEESLLKTFCNLFSL